MEDITILIPEAPFSDYSRGRVYISQRDNRRCIVLSKPGLTTLTTTYARYIFQVDLWKTWGKIIPDGFEVDHINENKLDDRIENLQLLTYQDNIKKNNYVRGSLHLVNACPICSKLFTREAHRSRDDQIYLCSPECLSAMGMSTISKDLRLFLKSKQQKYSARIYKGFPHGDEYQCDIIDNSFDCFYPNCLSSSVDWIPSELRHDLVVVSYEKRINDVKSLLKMGLSQRKIASQLNITRSAVETALKYI